MPVLAYRRHFGYLFVAAIVLAVAPDAIPAWLDRFLTINALYGLLHAIAVVLALNLVDKWPKRMSFVAMTAVLSATVPLFAIYSTNLLGVNDASFIAAFAIGSAAGAASYWLLVRAFWMSELSASSLLLTIFLCVAATMLSLVGSTLLSGFGARDSAVAGLLPTISWWVAFSSSLWLTNWSGHDR